jgi:hypothetical protein
MDVNEVLPLEGWLTFPEVAEKLGVTNQAVHKKVFGSGDSFPEVRSVGDKPLYVLPTSVVNRLLQDQEEASAARALRPSSVTGATLVGADEILARSAQ